MKESIERCRKFSKAQMDVQMAYIEVERKLRDAEDENDRLRSELDSVGIASYLYGRSDLKAENAKLRELASGLHKCLVNESCEGCPMQDDDGRCVRDIRLRDLGIEVTE